MKLQLIPEWKISWRFTSVQLAALLAFLSLVQADVLPHVQPLVPEKWWPLVSAGLALAIAVCRVLLQPGLRKSEEPGA